VVPVADLTREENIDGGDDSSLIFLDEKGSTVGGNLFLGIVDDDVDGRSLAAAAVAVADLTREDNIDGGDDSSLVFLDEEGSTVGGNLFLGIVGDDVDGRSLPFVKTGGAASVASEVIAAATFPCRAVVLPVKLPPEDDKVGSWRWLE
jgi:hypothetical protein